MRNIAVMIQVSMASTLARGVITISAVLSPTPPVPIETFATDRAKSCPPNFVLSDKIYSISTNPGAVRHMRRSSGLAGNGHDYR